MRVRRERGVSAPRVACALLAAGGSRRLGRPKQLVCSEHGEPLVRLAARAVAAARCSERAVVLGAHAAQVEAALTGLALTSLRNEDWAEGVAASIRVAVRWARASSADILLLAVCDQPALSAGQLDALSEAVRDPEAVSASRYADTLGVPAAFGSAWYERLLGLRGDQGAGPLLRASAKVEGIAFAAGAFDIDRESDVVSWAAAARASQQPLQ